jgi:hypothetical protein
MRIYIFYNLKTGKVLSFPWYDEEEPILVEVATKKETDDKADDKKEDENVH